MTTDTVDNGGVWQLEGYFPVYNGPEMTAFKATLEDDIRRTAAAARKAPDLDLSSADAWEKIVMALEDAQTRLEHWSSYIACLEAAHADREAYPR